MAVNPTLEASAIAKRYGPVRALDGADFSVSVGEIVALIGDNGAGKSTLVRILSGAEQQDSGVLRFDGKPVEFSSPVAALEKGIGTVYQDLSLAPDLDPAANLFLGREFQRPGLLGRLGVLDNNAMRDETAKAFDKLEVEVKSTVAPVGRLSGGQRQGVAVARAVYWARKIVLMDEPTAALGVKQTTHVLELIKRVAASGLGVVLISHNMPDVLACADRIEVLRLGKRVAKIDRSEATVEQLVAEMTGAAALRKESVAP
jgi:simple sugar transport system ATP-binding protein